MLYHICPLLYYYYTVPLYSRKINAAKYQQPDRACRENKIGLFSKLLRTIFTIIVAATSGGSTLVVKEEVG